jgi:hypothetical protein
MTLMRSTPSLGGLMQLGTYRCTGCGDVQTIERPNSVTRTNAASERRSHLRQPA